MKKDNELYGRTMKDDDGNIFEIRPSTYYGRGVVALFRNNVFITVCGENYARERLLPERDSFIIMDGIIKFERSNNVFPLMITTSPDTTSPESSRELLLTPSEVVKLSEFLNVLVEQHKLSTYVAGYAHE